MVSARLHPLHHAWRALPRGPRRAALLRSAALLAPRPDRNPPPAAPGCAVAGELDRASGIGEGARLCLEALERAGVPCWPVRPGGPIPSPGAPLLLHGFAPSLPLDLLRLGRALVRGRLVIGYWYWELPTAPPSWRAGLPFVHEVWAPSRFTADALEPLVGPVRVVPLPAAVRPPAPSALGRAAFGLPEDAFVTGVVFSLASSFERKNPLGAIEAHRRAFGGDPGRILLMHVTNPHHFPADFARLEAAAGSAGNVRIRTETLPRADAHALLACCDVLLSLHRSEGFGLVPAEAMLLGVPVVATDWSATAEWMDADCAALVPARLVPAQDPRGVYRVKGAIWAEPDLDEAAAWLQRLYADPALRSLLGTAGRDAASARLGPEPLLEAVRTIGLAG